MFPRVEASQHSRAVSPPRRLQAQIGIDAPGGDGHGPGFSVRLPEATGPRDALCLLDRVDDLMSKNMQPARTLPPGRLAGMNTRCPHVAAG